MATRSRRLSDAADPNIARLALQLFDRPSYRRRYELTISFQRWGAVTAQGMAVDRFSTLGRLKANGWFGPTERQKWASSAALSNPEMRLGLPALDRSSRALFEQALPRGVLAPRLSPDREPVNYWMPPHELAGYPAELRPQIHGRRLCQA
jgi:hypothetical protein